MKNKNFNVEDLLKAKRKRNRPNYNGVFSCNL